jgi:hypothetical protein
MDIHTDRPIITAPLCDGRGVFLRGSRSNSVITLRRAFAMVVRFAKQGIGLMFSDEVIFV